MAKLTAFELQTYQGGQWKIDSVFDDKQLAIFEAQRLQNAGRFSGIRVVEEVFDHDSGNSQTRIVFRGSKVDNINSAAREQQRANDAEVQAARQRAAAARAAAKTAGKKGAPANASFSKSPIFQILSLGAIIIAGVAIILLLRSLAEKL